MPTLLLLARQPPLQAADQATLHEAGRNAGCIVDHGAQEEAALERPHLVAALLVLDVRRPPHVDLNPVPPQFLLVAACQLVIFRTAGSQDGLGLLVELTGVVDNREAAQRKTGDKHRYHARLGDILVHGLPLGLGPTCPHPSASAPCAENSRPSRQSLMAARWRT